MSCCSFIILFLAQCYSFPTLPFIQTISVYCLRIFYSSEKDPTHNYFAGCFQNLLSPLCSTRALCTFLHCLFFYLFMHVPPPLSWEDLGIRDNILLVFEFLPLQQYLTHSISPIHFINEWIFWKLNVKDSTHSAKVLIWDVLSDFRTISRDFDARLIETTF